MKSSLQIRNKQMSVDMQMNNHNLLRWTAIAIDTNENFAKSLMVSSVNSTVFLTDSFYLVTHSDAMRNIPPNTHIVLWDGINSYIELLELQGEILERHDLKFFVVGWLVGSMLEQQVNIAPLYPESSPSYASSWGSFFKIKHQFHIPYQYRVRATFLSFFRYFKNWLADAKRHRELNAGRKIVFCGMVTPTEHQINGFFRGVNAPGLYQASLVLTKLNYLDNADAIDNLVYKIIEALKNTNLKNPTDFACAYSVLNLLHRMKTLSLLSTKSDALFINETKSNRWIDPYDSFFYRNNLYLDFGSTRGPDAIYPRTLDMVMKNKSFVSMRYLPARQTIDSYIVQISATDFLYQCECDAQSAFQTHQKMFN